MKSITRTALLLSCGALAGCAGGSLPSSPGAAGLSAIPQLRGGPAALRKSTPLTTGDNPGIYAFQGVPDGTTPYGDLINVNGTLYGTTYQGGTNNVGTVYSLTTGGSETVLHSFGTGSDGEYAFSGLVNLNGTLYGTTQYGGANGYGCVYSIDTAGNENIVYSFGSIPQDGFQPLGGLIASKGVLYGTTTGGGTNGGSGTVFKLTLGKKSKETILYTFKGGSDGAAPYGTLARDGTAFYGTTHGGGSNGTGTVFKVTPSGSETILHTFGPENSASDGTYPIAGLLLYNNKFYGTAFSGGAWNFGTVYSITKKGKETVLHSFGTPGSHSIDGENPAGDLVNVNGTLYGTTESDVAGSGSVFSLSPGGAVSTVFVFAAKVSSPYGYPAVPYSGLLDVNGMLYGTSLQAKGYGELGAVYAITP